MDAKELKERRQKLGLQRRDLAGHSYVDPRVLQLIELGEHADPESMHRLEKTLEALEAGQPAPVWKKKVEEEIASQDGVKKFEGST